MSLPVSKNIKASSHEIGLQVFRLKKYEKNSLNFLALIILLLKFFCLLRFLSSNAVLYEFVLSPLINDSYLFILCVWNLLFFKKNSFFFTFIIINSTLMFIINLYSINLNFHLYSVMYFVF